MVFGRFFFQHFQDCGCFKECARRELDLIAVGIHVQIEIRMATNGGQGLSLPRGFLCLGEVFLIPFQNRLL
jgi:hypothetical protein